MKRPLSTEPHAVWARKRREKNAKANRCINDSVARPHGLPVKGCRCQHCHDVHVSTRQPGSKRKPVPAT